MDNQLKAQYKKLTVFYDGSCPVCVKDRRFFERIAGTSNKDLYWLDITNQEDYLQQQGIDPLDAMRELHVQLPNGQILKELDAYIELMGRVWLLKPIAWLIALPALRPWLAKKYHQKVTERLTRDGRL